MKLKIFFALLFLIPIYSYGILDFEGFARLRSAGANVPVITTSSQIISLPENVSENPSFFSNHFSIYAQGVFKPSQNFEVYFSGRSSILVEEIGYLVLDKNYSDYFQSYFHAKFFIHDNFSVRLGRLHFESNFDEVLSSNDYEAYPYFFDGLFLNYSTDFISVDLWGAKVPMKRYGIYEQPLDKGTGINLDVYSVSDFLSYVNLYLVYLFNFEDGFKSLFQDGNDSKKTTRFGIGMGGKLTNINLDYKLFGIAHGKGFKFKSEENMWHAQVAYNKINFFGSRFIAGYHRDSKQYNPWLYDYHNNAGFLDLLSWGNLTYFFFAYESSFSDLFKLKMSLLNMNSTEKGDIYLGRAGSFFSRTDSFNVDGSTHLGWEIDAQIEAQIKKNFKMDILFGLFLPESHFKETIADFGKEYYSHIELQASYNF